MQEYSIFGILISWLKCSRNCFIFCRQVFSLASCQRVIQSSFYFLSLFICCSIFFVSPVKAASSSCQFAYNVWKTTASSYSENKDDSQLKSACESMSSSCITTWPTYLEEGSHCNCAFYSSSDDMHMHNYINIITSCGDEAIKIVSKQSKNDTGASEDRTTATQSDIKKLKSQEKADDEENQFCQDVHLNMNQGCDVDCKTLQNVSDKKNFLKRIYITIIKQQCLNQFKALLQSAFISTCTTKLSYMNNKKGGPLFCPNPNTESNKNNKDNNKENCETYCKAQFDNFYMSNYSMEDSLNGYSKEQFAEDYLADFNQSDKLKSKCEDSPDDQNCGNLSIAYLTLTKDEKWWQTHVLGQSPTENYQAPLEGKTALGKWLNKKLFGSTNPKRDMLTLEAIEKGFHWEKCDIDKENPTDCQKEIKAALAKAGEVCSKEIEKVVSCCASPITCASGETSVPSLTTAFGLIYALQDVAAQIHVTSGPIGEDVYEYQREVCQRMKQANIGKAGISGAMAAMCKAASVSCQSGCTDTTDEAFAVFDKHCGYEGGKQRMEALKKGQHIDFDKLFICTQDFFGRYAKEYRAVRKMTAECSKASAVGFAHLQQMGISGAQALMLEQAGCGVRPKDPECTGNQFRDKLNKRNDCTLDCKKFDTQPACSCDKPPYHDGCIDCEKDSEHKSCKKNFCIANPHHIECDCGLDKNKDSLHCDCDLHKNRNSLHCFSGGGGADCTEAANKDHPDCQKDLSRGDGEFPENEEEDLISANPQGEGNPAPGGLMAGASGSGGVGLKGLGGGGGGPAGGGKKRRGKRKVQSILQGFKGRGQFGGYGFGSGGGGNPEKEGKGKKAKNKMTVDLGKYFKKKGRLGSGAHKNIFQRISKRFKWMCKQRKIECI